jgi:plastocyanin
MNIRRSLVICFLLLGGPAVFAACAGSGAASAGELLSQISDDEGKPVADAVVALTPADGSAPDSAEPALWENLRSGVIDQREETFIPYVEIIGRGGSVVFRNNDTPRHHVYSFSPIKSFEFVLKPGESSLPVQFDKPGVAAIGCNIHDDMIAYVYVSDTPWVALTDQSGRARIAALPAGAYIARIWHPALRPGRPAPAQPIAIFDGAPTTLAAALELLPIRRRDREHGLY